MLECDDLDVVQEIQSKTSNLVGGRIRPYWWWHLVPNLEQQRETMGTSWAMKDWDARKFGVLLHEFVGRQCCNSKLFSQLCLNYQQLKYSNWNNRKVTFFQKRPTKLLNLG